MKKVKRKERKGKVMRKKVLCILLSLCVVISMFPAVALAGGEVTTTVAFDWDTALGNTLNTDDESGYMLSTQGKDVTLTLRNISLTGSIEIPFGANGYENITIVIDGDNAVESISGFLCSCTIQGNGTLTLGQIGAFYDGGQSKLTVEEGASVTVNNVLDVSESGNGAQLDVNGELKVIPGENGNLNCGVRVGFCSIGAQGVLNVDADKKGVGIELRGMGAGDLLDLDDVLSIADGGKLDVKTNGGTAVRLYREEVPGSFEPNAASAFVIPNGYLGEQYATILEKASGEALASPDEFIPNLCTIAGGIVDYSNHALYSPVVVIPVESNQQTSGGSSRGPWYSVITEESKGGSVELTGSFVRIVSNAYARRGTELTLTPKPADGYMLKTLYINDEPAENTPYVFSILEDVTVKAVFEKTQAQLVKEAGDYASSIKLIARSELTKTSKGKKAVKLYWYEKNGRKLSFDGYEIYRSVKKSSYGKKPIFTTKKTQYLNTAIKKGTRYYYKLRGYKQIGDIKLYSDWSTQAWRKVK